MEQQQRVGPCTLSVKVHQQAAGSTALRMPNALDERKRKGERWQDVGKILSRAVFLGKK